jgi:hypothetical protein
VPEFIDPDFAKTSPERLFLLIENERFGLAVAKTGSINSGTGEGNHFPDLRRKMDLFYLCYFCAPVGTLSNSQQFF